jgi:hypothetical protein
MSRWPPILWLGVSVASVLILAGSVGGIRPPLLIAGTALLVADFLVSAYLALRPGQGPMKPILTWTIGGLALFYAAVAAGASLAGAEYALAALIAGLVPMTAACLWVATVRRKTAEGDEDAYPGLALDDETALGDTPAHSDALDEEAGPRPTPRFRRLQRRESIEK